MLGCGLGDRQLSENSIFRGMTAAVWCERALNDCEYLIPTKFHQNPSSSSGGCCRFLSVFVRS